ncbi:NAD(P)-dependent oxidoreductase [Mesorhizobium intechi]|uniref:NAD(P)-dependent oxidoreductase n=1 Tax=Mesorhizobium intechi TaxID=537601 RepID=UPI00142E9641|nr:SDR family oxidoreductase [Mesorhizobium intechi]
MFPRPTAHLRRFEMKILVLGATGKTGRLIVSKAIAEGHEVVALVRSREKAGDLAGAELAEGDARDAVALARAIAGCDAVVSSLGTAMSPFREVTLLSTATRALVGVMERQNIRRLVCITGLGAGDSRGHGGFFFDRLVLPLLLRKVYEDKDRQEDAIRGSTLDWTIVRPMVLNDKPPRGRVKALTDLSGVHGGTIARADVADFVVQQLTADTWLRKSPLITW